MDKSCGFKVFSYKFNHGIGPLDVRTFSFFILYSDFLDIFLGFLPNSLFLKQFPSNSILASALVYYVGKDWTMTFRSQVLFDSFSFLVTISFLTARKPILEQHRKHFIGSINAANAKSPLPLQCKHWSMSINLTVTVPKMCWCCWQGWGLSIFKLPLFLPYFSSLSQEFLWMTQHVLVCFYACVLVGLIWVYQASALHSSCLYHVNYIALLWHNKHWASCEEIIYDATWTLSNYSCVI